MRRSIAALAVVVATLAPASAGLPVAVGGHVGTTGFGIDVHLPVTTRIAVNAQVNRGRYSHEVTIDELDYSGKIDLKSAGLRIDVYPFRSDFRASVGLYANRNEVPVSAWPSQPVALGDGAVTYTPAEIGALRADIRFRRTAPYLGIGYGNPNAGTRWHPSFDLGVLLQGKPEVTLAATGTAVGDPAFDAAVETERVRLESKVNGYRMWPVVVVSVTYRF